jgi:pimeloyl-ACP methyl ester carboxylesterase
MQSSVNGARIHYERDGSGFPLFFLHAGVADSRMWEPQVPAFAEHFDVIRPDQRGFGQSELPATRWSPVADLLEMIEQLRLKPAHLVGCSMGGSIAIDFAIQYPERVSKLVLVGTGIGGANFGKKYPEIWTGVKAADESGDLEALNQAEMHLFLDGPQRPRGYVRQPLRDLFLSMNGTSLKNDWETAPTDDLTPPAVERLSEITAPTLIVVGDKDVPTIYDAADLLMKSLPQARQVVINDAAHLPNLEHPDEFNRLVLDFLLEE